MRAKREARGPAHTRVMPHVHFENIVTGRAPCSHGSRDDAMTVDPARVTCPECLRHLGREVEQEDVGRQPPSPRRRSM